MNTFWRVQNRAGEGPYRDRIIRQAWCGGRHNDPGHPGPYDEQWHGTSAQTVMLVLTSHDSFAFRDRQDALKWFNQKELDLLRALGFFLVRVKGTLAFQGRRQVIINRR